MRRENEIGVSVPPPVTNPFERLGPRITHKRISGSSTAASIGIATLIVLGGIWLLKQGEHGI